MFAIAAWDRNSGKLFLSRDRMGEKHFTIHRQ